MCNKIQRAAIVAKCMYKKDKTVKGYSDGDRDLQQRNDSIITQKAECSRCPRRADNRANQADIADGTELSWLQKSVALGMPGASTLAPRGTMGRSRDT